MKTGVLKFMVVISTAVATAGCGNESPFDEEDGSPLCSVDPDLLFASLPPDAIPGLTLPDIVSVNSDDAGYLFDFDRVLGVVVNGEARAYPHNILWHHEIVNDRIGDTWISATFCPLTGSGLVFDLFVDGERLELGVSGLLFANNLVLFDHVTSDVYGPQLAIEGKCSRFRDESLGLRPVQEMIWDRWKDLHPDTKVVSGATDFGRNYCRYPYGSYDNIASNELLFTMGVDRSRQIKKRVLVIRVGEEGRGYPFGELEKSGATSVVNDMVGVIPTAIVYESRDGEAAVVFDTRIQGQTLTFSVSGPST